MVEDAVFPEGHVHWVFRLFQCFGRPIEMGVNPPKNYTLILNRFVYTTDGKFFYGYYTPDDLEDLDPFTMLPPDFICCCQCCCWFCCQCYRDKYDETFKKEADLFFSAGKEKETQPN